MNKKIKKEIEHWQDWLSTCDYEYNWTCIEAHQIKTLLDYITNLQESEAYYYGQYKDYKSRNENAIDYIEHLSNVFIDSKEQDKILEILGGSDSNVI